jgi:hypothetical protein
VAVTVVACLALASELQASSNSRLAKDQAATYTYLRAAYVYERAVDARLAQSAAAMQALSSEIAGECPGVVAGAPSPNPATPNQGPSASQRAAQVLELEQRRWLTQELTTALLTAWLQPDEKAADALARSLAPLRWSSQPLTRQAQLDAGGLRELTNGSVFDVCSDMQAWAQSGYETLAAPTEELRKQSKARSDIGGLTARLEVGLKAPLTPYEGRHGRALAARVETLRVKEIRSLTPALIASELSVRKTLGFGAAEEAEESAGS